MKKPDVQKYIIYKLSNKKEMQKAINRFWDWLFHPSIRWYHYPKGKASWFRYPSPGNIIRKHPVKDYKTPYEYSELNIRYAKPNNAVLKENLNTYIGDGVGLKVIDKLRAAGLLQSGINDEQRIEEAKRKFQQKYGVPVEQRIIRNDFTGFQIPEGTNRQSYRQAIQAEFKQTVEQDKKLNMPNSNRRFVQEPEAVWMESLDMFSHPHFQQTRIDVNYKLDNYAKNNAERGFIEIRKGERSFWKALDDSNDPKNIERVQGSIGDDRPNDFSLRETRIEFQKDKNGNVTDVHPKTRSV